MLKSSVVTKACQSVVSIMETIIGDSMKQKYQSSTRVKRAQLQALRKEFEILQMKEGENVDAYFAQLTLLQTI